MKTEKIAVCSKSFSKNSQLRCELEEKYKFVKYNDGGVNFSGAALVDFLKGYSKAIVGLEKIDESVLKQLPELKVVSKYGVGIDAIDMTAMNNYGVRLGWTPGVNRRAVSELVLGLILNLLRKINIASSSVIKGEWRQFIGGELTGKTVGIIGCGNVGQDLIKLLQPFGCKFISYDKKNYSEFYNKYNVERQSLDGLLQKSQIVSVHLPLNKSTVNILNKDKLKLLRKDALLINAARGGLVDEIYLKTMLMNDLIGGAAFDVFSSEPLVDQDLNNLPNFIATPHIGGSSIEAIMAMGRAAIEGLDKNFIPDTDD